MAGGRAFKSNVRERREAERRMKAMEKRRKKEEKKRRDDAPGPPLTLGSLPLPKGAAAAPTFKKK
jgi:hypothetical protein